MSNDIFVAVFRRNERSGGRQGNQRSHKQGIHEAVVTSLCKVTVLLQQWQLIAFCMNLRKLGVDESKHVVGATVACGTKGYDFNEKTVLLNVQCHANSATEIKIE